MSRQDVLKKAELQLGITESPPNSNRTKYGLWYSRSLNGQKWCAIFVSWVFDHAGHPLGDIQTKNGIHHCQSAYNYYKEKGRFTSNPQPGDLVIYDWEGNGYADHLGIFVQWINEQKTMFDAIEGNTSTADESNGGQVMKRIRSLNLVKAFINPGVYEDETVIPDTNSLRIGARGAKVAQVQKHLYTLCFTVEIDGWFGKETQSCIKEFQNQNKMHPTGIADAITIGALEEDAHQLAFAKSKFVTGSYLRRGNVGIMVSNLQRALNANDPLLQLTISGCFDATTMRSVKTFQLKNNLKPDGIVGPLTFKKLEIV